jgi:fibronectin-binding autotransporter adhesin
LVTLDGVSTYSGGTALQAGEIVIGTNGALGSGALSMNTAELRSSAHVTLTLPQIAINAGQQGTFSTVTNTVLALSSGTFSHTGTSPPRQIPSHRQTRFCRAGLRVFPSNWPPRKR